jgi:hypothetical protein
MQGENGEGAAGRNGKIKGNCRDGFVQKNGKSQNVVMVGKEFCAHWTKNKTLFY